LVIVLIFVSAASATANAYAVELQPLNEWMGRPDDERDPSYLFVRCAGLYQGASAYAGAEKLGKATWDQYSNAIYIFAAAAHELRANDPANVQREVGASDLMAQIVENIETIAGLYVTRFKANYAASGNAFIDDRLIASDFETCNGVLRNLTNQ
jgi:hypothetical protein